MPTEQEIMDQTLKDGGTLADVQAKLAAQAATPPAPDGQMQPAAELMPDVMTKAQADAYVEAERRKWESGATSKFEAAKRADDLARALQTNPRGTIAFLAEQYGVTMQTNEPRQPIAHQPEPPDYQAEVSRLREKARTAKDFEEQWDAVDKLTDLKAAKLHRESVRPLQETLVSTVEEQTIRALEAQGVQNVRQLLPQIKRYQSDIQKSPYLRVDEALNIIEAPNLRRENAELKAKLARPAADDKQRGTVSGAQAGAPRQQSTAEMSLPDMAKALETAGFRRDRE